MKKGDFKFVFNAFIVALVLMAIMHAFAPYVGLSKAKLADIESVRSATAAIGPQELEKQLAAENSKPTLLIVYASWCKYCRQTMPAIAEMMRSGELDMVNTVFLSRDRSNDDLALYLVRSGLNGLFTPLREDRAESEHLISLLQGKGARYDGGIPYMAFFDAKGRFLMDMGGVTDRNRLLSALSQAGVKNR